MNLVRTPVAAVLTSLLAVALSSGCPAKTPEGTSTPPGEGPPPTDTGEVADPADTGGEAPTGEQIVEAEPQEPAAESTCEAKVADAPKLLFANTVLARPPAGVDLQEAERPGVAIAVQSGGYISACDNTVKRMGLYRFQNDPNKALSAFVDEFIKQLETQGYTGGTLQDPRVDEEIDYHRAVHYPASSGQEPINLYVAGRRLGDFIFVATYEAAPGEFEQLLPTFEASAKTILLAPK